MCCVIPEPTVETHEALEPKRNNYVGKIHHNVTPTVRTSLIMSTYTQAKQKFDNMGTSAALTLLSYATISKVESEKYVLGSSI